MKIKYRSLIISVLMVSFNAFADIQSEAELMLGTSVNNMLAVLSNKSLNKDEKKVSIIDIINPIFDFKLMAKLTLGKRHWRGIDDSQKLRFISLFTQRIHTSVLEKFLLFENETVELGKSILVKNKIHIPMNMESKGETYSILFKIYNAKNQQKVYDIEIQNISIISTYRSQYSQALNRGTIDDLFKIMEEKIAARNIEPPVTVSKQGINN